MFGAATMSLSSFYVVTNALRLNLFKVHDASRDKKIKQNVEEIHYISATGGIIISGFNSKRKMDIIGNEYAILMEKDFREDVSIRLTVGSHFPRKTVVKIIVGKQPKHLMSVS